MVPYIVERYYVRTSQGVNKHGNLQLLQLFQPLAPQFALIGQGCAGVLWGNSGSGHQYL